MVKRIKLRGRAIDIRGRLIWKYDPPVLNKNLNGGNTYRLLVHNEHVWTINNNLKEFYQSHTFQTKAFQESIIE